MVHPDLALRGSIYETSADICVSLKNAYLRPSNVKPKYYVHSQGRRKFGRKHEKAYQSWNDDCVVSLIRFKLSPHLDTAELMRMRERERE